MGLARSFLYVPADRESVILKSGARGADALILDLEDAVTPDSKSAARQLLTKILQTGIDGAGEILVRVNPPSLDRGALTAADIKAAVSPQVSGVVVAKTESAADLEFVTQALHAAEREQGLEVGYNSIAPIIESPIGIENLQEIARFPGVVRLNLGEVDIISALGLDPGEDELELLPLRSALVVASAAAGLRPPAGSVFRDWADLDGLRTSSLRLRRLGFLGRSVIHPAQISTVHEVFTPNDAEIAAAQKVADRYASELANGNGAYLDDEGRMVDIAVVRAAWRTLSLVPPIPST
jgi:citrate lyase subunit beta / citryl-CoA lyase